MDRHTPAVPQCGSKLQTEALPTDVRKVIIGEEQQEWSSLDQGDQKPPIIKEEEEELGISPEEEEGEEDEDADLSVRVKTEEDEEKPELLELHLSQTERDRDAQLPNSCSTEHVGTLSQHKTTISDSSDTDMSGRDGTKTSLNAGENDVGKKPVTCPECGKGFCSKSSLNWHRKIHTGRKPFICSVCATAFTQRHTLVQHMRTHTGDKPFACAVCGKGFGQSSDLKKHARVHTGERPFCCSLCAKRFTQQPDLVAHFRIHTGEKPFSCTVCQKRFRISGNVSRHMRLHKTVERGAKRGVKASKPQRDLDPENETAKNVTESGSDGKSFRCLECGRTFCRRDHLMSHMRAHTEEKPLGCSVCQSCFDHGSGVLARVELCCAEEKPLRCSPCGAQRIRAGEKLAGGHLCEKSLANIQHTAQCTSVEQLETRKSLSEPSPPGSGAPAKEVFRCAECGKTFSLKGNLKKHSVIHTGEKPFACSVCGKSFKQNVHLTKHMTIHTGDKLYKCDVCDRGFNKKSLVEKHACV